MSRNDEIEDFDFQDIFLALDRHIRYKIYSTSDSEASVPSSSSSITSARAACLLLTLRVSRTGSKIASFRSRGPAGPSSPWFQFLITVKDRKEVKLSVVVVVCYCLLLSVVVCCCQLLSVVVCCCLLPVVVVVVVVCCCYLLSVKLSVSPRFLPISQSSQSIYTLPVVYLSIANTGWFFLTRPPLNLASKWPISKKC